MGYEVGHTTTRVIKVKLRNTEFDGAEARATSLTVREYLDRDSSDDGIMEAFLERLLDWNLEVEGEPVPATVEAGNNLDKSLVASLAVGWMRAINRIEIDRPFVPENEEEETSNGGPVELETL